MIEIYERVWVKPSAVQGVYLRSLHGIQDQMTVVLLDTHEIRLPGDHVVAIKDLVEAR